MKPSGPPAKKDEAAWVLWGTYEPATLSEVQQGMHCVKFADGGTRWATVSEIIADAPPPLERLRVGDAVMAPSGGKRSYYEAPHYSQVSVVRLPEPPAKPSSLATVQSLEPGPRGTCAVEQVLLSNLRLPLAWGAMLGAGPAVASGDRVSVLRGNWVAATVEENASPG